jgi:N-acyl-D-aspartate/D-glutamate deacylase
VIRGGTVVDGTGAAPFEADVLMRDGKIAAVGKNLSAPGAEEVDAAGCIVTPGFVDIHTHYDGQSIWSDRLQPSSQHGVTTVVMGNCGVGFAPCRPDDRETLIHLMEGVEDIPGAVMGAGLTWDWETFPEYLDAVDKRPRDIDVGAYVPHSPLRVYVMGERGVKREKATAADLEKMTQLTKQAVEAGALGCATSRVHFHRTPEGDFIPTYRAAEDELHALARGMTEAGKGVLQLVGNVMEDGWQHDFDLMCRISEQSGRPVTYTTGAGPDSLENSKKLAAANREGKTLTGQMLPRPVGLLMAHNLTWTPFSFCPSFAALAELPDEQRLAELRKPEVKAKLLSETPELKLPLAGQTRNFPIIFPLGDVPNYEPLPSDSVAARAAADGVSPGEWAYDYLLTKDGKAQLMVAMGGLSTGSLDIMRPLMDHPNLTFGLGDGGAHYGMICDASYTTYVLTHWVRDRNRGRLPLELAIQQMSNRTAQTVGLNDRGVLKPGYKADVNVIDFDKLTLHAPFVARDLPGGGRRLLQTASGYRATFVSGEAIYKDGKPTGVLPGKLVRGAQTAPKAA